MRQDMVKALKIKGKKNEKIAINLSQKSANNNKI